jgi:hypothetical protein
MIIRHPFSYDFLQEYVSHFLDTRSIVELSSTNKTIHTKLEKRVKSHKLFKLFNKFHNSETNRFSLYQGLYCQHEASEISNVFDNLKHLFDFISDNKITFLDLGMTTSYGGYNDFIYSYYTGDCIKELLNCLRSNTTLNYVNLGLFKGMLDRDELLEIMENHPTLSILSLNANGATTYFNQPPNSLYKKGNGSAVWSHFKPT